MYGNWQSPHTGPINSGSDEGEKYCCLMRFEAAASDISHYDYESEGRSVNDSDIYSYQGSTRYINGSATPTTNTYLGIINIVAKGGQGGAYYDYTVPSGDLDNRLLVPRSYAVDERYSMYAKLQKRPSSGNYSDLTIGTGYGWSVAWNYSHCYLRIHSLVTLQTTGAISLNDLHIEVGGTTGTTVSLNDTDIRDLITTPSGAINLQSFYGASSIPPFDYTAGMEKCQQMDRIIN